MSTCRRGHLLIPENIYRRRPSGKHECAVCRLLNNSWQRVPISQTFFDNLAALAARPAAE